MTMQPPPPIYKDRGGSRMTFGPGSIFRFTGGQVIPPDTFVRFYYVDSTNGDDDDYDGLSAEKPFASIQAAMDAITARGVLRGRNAVYVAPGGYTEDIVTPLDTVAPFGALIATNPTENSRGAVWLAPDTATEPIITVRARGWRISGFEFDPGASGGAVKMDGTSSDCDAKFLELDHCLFVGVATAYGILTDEDAPWTNIHHNQFYNFGLEAITATDYPMYWEINHNWFEDCVKMIAPRSSKGPNAANIHHNVFQHTGAHYVSTHKIDTRGGSQNLVHDNLLPSTYDEAGGYFSSSTDWWYGNHSEDLGGTARPIA